MKHRVSVSPRDLTKFVIIYLPTDEVGPQCRADSFLWEISHVQAFPCQSCHQHAFIVNPSYCIQINSSEGEKGGVCVCFGGLFDRQLAYKHE